MKYAIFKGSTYIEKCYVHVGDGDYEWQDKKLSEPCETFTGKVFDSEEEAIRECKSMEADDRLFDVDNTNYGYIEFEDNEEIPKQLVWP